MTGKNNLRPEALSNAQDTINNPKYKIYHRIDGEFVIKE
jgi:hypothetical protein